MSLFQAREWWTVASGNAEEYTYGALSVGNVDNDPTPHDKIVVGSLNGTLRVYYPTHGEFKIDHLLMEEHLEHPILQVEVGRFVPHSSNVGIAVLHPKHLAVYCLDGVGGAGMAASYFKLTKKYEHPLGLDGEHFTAFNMTIGSFGKSPEKDHICVQSLDGRLQFFEQDRFSFMQQLPTCLVPGTMCYAAATDSLITATSDLHVECYRYQVMATSVVLKKKHNDDGAKQDAKEAKGVTAVKALHSEWRTNLGELVLDIRTGKFHWEVRARSFDVVVLGEFSLFCLTPSGDVCFHKRLGFHPSSLCLYSRPLCDNSESTDNVIIATHAKQWMIFRDAHLIWSAVAPSISTALSVSSFGGIDGMVVSLDDDGRLSVNYLGTDPPTTSVMASDAKEVNYEEMDEEHRTLLNIIRRSQGERRTEPKERVLLRAQVPALLDPPSLHTEADLRTFTGRENADENVTTDGDVVTGPDHKPVALTMRVYVTYTGSNVLNNVTIAITPPANVIVCGPSSILLDSIDGKAGTPLILPIVLRPSASVMPSSLDVIISAAYTLESGQPRTSLCTVKLPMCMMCRLIPPVKASTFKFTLDTNQEPPQLTELFDDMLTQPGATPDWAKQVTGSAANVLSFQYYNGIDVTILVSKNAGRYRIQSTELDALWMVSNELVDRLQLLHVQQTQGDDDDDPSALPPPLHIQYQEPLPLADFFAAIDEHFAYRKEMAELHAELNDRAHQFRVIQKRLLVRYKDRSPSPLNCLDMLLHGTYSQLLDLSRRVDHVQSKVQVSANRLACSVHLLLMLIRYKFDLDDDNFAVLSAHLSPRVADAWEESTETAMTDLLKTALAVKKENAAAVAGVPVELVLPEDTKKLKKHITIVCDRLGKGGRLVGGATSAAAAAGKSDANDDDGGKEEKDSGAKP
ncbi:hypothetical protein, variant 1 [Aphanomyces astaci]|uniref:PTHB1 N-terminal domain-containing protein n=1 Tax=Aphanomyces astaci TaxID=112090 RepID=W4FFM4_APHAT|nr:hypothetical protein, variant 1 [Aphanomyces astaci]ETV66245.1 hypothetical protein, variant 1 [Aphanomyces astaci]|eukprot:XP_009844234.1 hypothetical protein, variant 1 [Aphanomyces astaci]